MRFLLSVCLALLAPLAHAEDPLPPTEAFRVSASQLDAHTLEVRYTIAKGYYLYRNKFDFSLSPASAKLGTPVYPAGESHTDAFFGTQTVFRGALSIRLPVDAPAGTPLTLGVTAQGCADMGICYPPDTQTLSLAASDTGTPAPTAQNWLDQFRQPDGQGEMSQAATPAPQQDIPGQQLAAPTPPAAPAAQDEDDDGSRFARLLQGGQLAWIALSFFGLGLLMSFTPCVLPMLPILTGIIVGHGNGISRGRAAALCLAYVLGMAVTYTIAGVAAGLSGTLLANALQNVWVLGAFALVFVVLALAMFGAFELQLPAAMQTRLSGLVTRPGGSLARLAAMGALSALIVGPCMAAPLAGALLYIARSGNAAVGGLALFSMALGMGVPLLLAGVAARHWLPKPGPWMEGVKRFFGVLLLATAIWLVSPVLPPLFGMLAWAALLTACGVLLRALDSLPPRASLAARMGKAGGLMCLVAGAMMLVGALAGSRDPLQPLAGLRAGTAAASQAPRFEPVRSVAELDARVAEAGKPVMLDFYADWCVSCREMERFTFSDPAVAERLSHFVLLRADVTANTADDQALLKRFGLFGPPGIIFYTAQGQEIPGVRVIGFKNAEDFGRLLERVAGRGV